MLWSSVSENRIQGVADRSAAAVYLDNAEEVLGAGIEATNLLGQHPDSPKRVGGGGGGRSGRSRASPGQEDVGLDQQGPPGRSSERVEAHVIVEDVAKEHDGSQAPPPQPLLD